jgi:hypothetical protein
MGEGNMYWLLGQRKTKKEEKREGESQGSHGMEVRRDKV